MDNHPIPQDITGFQFKLIGDMTVKQFAYLCLGIIPGWIFFILPFPSFVKLPISFLFVLFGLSLAFLPVAGRPMDVMVGNFIKALFRPTQYIYQKSYNVLQDGSKIYEQKGETKIIEPIHRESVSQPQLITVSLDQVQTVPYQPQHAEKKEEKKEETSEDKKEKLEEEIKTLEQRLQKEKQEEERQKNTSFYEMAHQKALETEKLLADSLSQKQKLEEEILRLKKELEQKGKDVYKPKVETQNVREIKDKDLAKKAGFPIAPEYPNIITGIIKDPRGNPLPNILVEIKDSTNNPVRAFKTNPLGQFASATALPNGVYRIEFEDPTGKNKFDTVEFEVKGEIISPIEVFSSDQREELRKELFGQN